MARYRGEIKIRWALLGILDRVLPDRRCRICRSLFEDRSAVEAVLLDQALVTCRLFALGLPALRGSAAIFSVTLKRRRSVEGQEGQ
jgi:hypothetical protein